MFQADVRKISRITDGVLYGLEIIAGETDRTNEEVIRTHIQALADRRGFNYGQVKIYTQQEGRKRFVKGRGKSRDDFFTRDCINRFSAFAVVQDKG